MRSQESGLADRAADARHLLGTQRVTVKIAAREGAGAAFGCLASRRWPSTAAPARSMSLRLALRASWRSVSSADSSVIEWRFIPMPFARSTRARRPKRSVELVILDETAKLDMDRALPVIRQRLVASRIGRSLAPTLGGLRFSGFSTRPASCDTFVGDHARQPSWEPSPCTVQPERPMSSSRSSTVSRPIQTPARGSNR